MKQFLALIFGALLLVGCDKIEGQLNISKDIKLVSSKGVSRTLKVGTYTADIKANTKKKITLRLNNDADEKYVFNIPDGSIPSNGSFTATSDVVGQPVDLFGNVKTVVSNSDRKQVFESCQYQETVQVCYPTGPNGQVSCSIQMQTRFGSRWVTYYDRTTQKDIELSIHAAKSSDESAQFVGDALWIDRIVLNETQCR
jgi:hypothetical protein